MKQGSEKIIAKTAGYIDGFLSRALEMGFSLQGAKNIYKEALALFEPAAAPKPAQVNQKEAAHFEGFMARAEQLGMSKEAAYQLFVDTFTNK